MPMKGLRRKNDAMKTLSCTQIIHYSLVNFPLKPLPLLPVTKNGLTTFFKIKINQGNEQLRIDGDFYPCAF